APGDHAHRLDQLGRLYVLEQEAARAGADGLVDVLVEVEGREDHDAGLRAPGRDAPRRLHAVAVGHAHVHQDHVRLETPGQLDGLGAVLGFAHDREVLARLEDHAEATTDQGLVVGEQHPDHRGSLASTRNPCPGSGPATTSPPSRLARSCIPTSPRPRTSPFALPTPSSLISSSRRSDVRRTPTSACDAAACLSVLVNASWTMRYADRSSPVGRPDSSPSTLSST